MCGRFVLEATPEEIVEAFELMDMELDPFPPRYNIAPTQPVLVVTAGSVRPMRGANRPDRRAMLARWGLIPVWAKSSKDMPLLFNARSESAAEKGSFRAAMRHRRALVPASGFYEWRRQGKAKPQPFWVRPRQGGVIAYAGLVETYMDPNGSEIDTAAILTTAANDDLKGIHDRMPVVIQPEDYARWLECRDQEPRDVADLLKPAENGFFEAIPVSDKVNKVDNMGPDLLERVDPEATPTAEPQPEKQKPGDAGQLDLF